MKMLVFTGPGASSRRDIMKTDSTASATIGVDRILKSTKSNPSKLEFRSVPIKRLSEHNKNFNGLATTAKSVRNGDGQLLSRREEDELHL